MIHFYTLWKQKTSSRILVWDVSRKLWNVDFVFILNEKNTRIIKYIMQSFLSIWTMKTSGKPIRFQENSTRSYPVVFLLTLNM